MSRRLTARRVRRAREWVDENRCPKRPGIVHDWAFSHWETPWDYTRGTPDFAVYRCVKCAEWSS